ncbi:MAG TPA: MOSC domain-containing protein [Candidatus Dormibacteraeota bacterium]
MTGRLVSVNVGTVAPLTAGRRTVESGIVKAPVTGRVRAEGVNLAGDRQADLSVHGGADKAVYAYAIEDHRWWGEGLGRALGPGTFGENLTVSGLEVSGAVVGERWEVGSALLEVAQPRLPCYKLGMRMGDPVFVARFAAANRPGAYLRIVEPGDLGAGDAVRVLDRPAHGVTVAEVSRALLGERAVWAHVLGAAALPAGLRDHLLERLQAAEAQSSS